jgi:hypothetical protein
MTKITMSEYFLQDTSQISFHKTSKSLNLTSPSVLVQTRPNNVVSKIHHHSNTISIDMAHVGDLSRTLSLIRLIDANGVDPN